MPKVHELVSVFARFGNFTFGGGDPTVAVLRDEIIGKRAWMTAQRADLAFALARLTPGTNVLAFCTAIGWLLRGWSGAAAALIGASVPSGLITVIFTALYERWGAIRT